MSSMSTTACWSFVQFNLNVCSWGLLILHLGINLWPFLGIINFAVYFGDHLRSGIINFVVGDHAVPSPSAEKQGGGGMATDTHSS